MNNTAPDDLDAKQNATNPGYCVKCQATREMTDTKSIERGGGPALEGKCVVCGGTSSSLARRSG